MILTPVCSTLSARLVDVNDVSLTAEKEAVVIPSGSVPLVLASMRFCSSIWFINHAGRSCFET